MYVAEFYCHRCKKVYRLQFLSKEEVVERQRDGLNPPPLTCPIGHSEIERVK